MVEGDVASTPAVPRRDAGRGVVVVLDVQDRPAFFDGLRGAPQRVVLLALDVHLYQRWASEGHFLQHGIYRPDGNLRGHRPLRRVPPRQLLVSAPTGDGIVLVLVRVGPPVERPLDQRELGKVLRFAAIVQRRD